MRRWEVKIKRRKKHWIWNIKEFIYFIYFTLPLMRSAITVAHKWIKDGICNTSAALYVNSIEVDQIRCSKKISRCRNEKLGLLTTGNNIMIRQKKCYTV